MTMALEKQKEVRKYLQKLTEKIKQKLEKEVEKKKDEYVKKHFSETKKRIEREFVAEIKRCNEISERLRKRLEEIKYSVPYDFSGQLDEKIDDATIERFLKSEYDNKTEDKRKSIEQEIEEKGLEITEKMLFADESELYGLVKELKNMKLDF